MGGSGQANQNVRRPFIRCTSSPSSSVATAASVATTTARGRSTPSAVSTSWPNAVRRTDVTRTPVRRGRPGSAASCSGNACMPSAGMPGVARKKLRISSRTNVAEVAPLSSASTPARNGSSTSVRSRPVTPAPAHEFGQALVVGRRAAGGPDRVREPASGRAGRARSGWRSRCAGSGRGSRAGVSGSVRVDTPESRTTSTPRPKVRRSRAATSTCRCHGRVRRVEQLEAAVAPEPVDDIRAHAAARRGPGLQQQRVDPVAAGESACTAARPARHPPLPPRARRSHVYDATRGRMLPRAREPDDVNQESA